MRLPALTARVRQFIPDLVALTALVIFAWLAFVHYGDVQSAMDISLYREIAVRADAMFHGIAQHVDSEYPPLAVALFWVTYSLTSGADFAGAWLTLIVIGAMCAWIYVRCFSPRDAALVALALPVAVMLLGHDMVFARFDIVVGLLLILSVITHAHRAYTESAIFLTLAIGLKIVPVLALPLLFLVTPRRHWVALAIGLLCAVALGIALSVGVLGLEGVIDNLRYVAEYHGDRPVQLESLWSGLSMLHAFSLGRVIHTGFDFMSYFNADVTHHAVTVAKLLVIGGLGFLVLRLLRARQQFAFGAVLAVILLWALAVSPVLSPQYFTWVVPLVLVVMGGRFLDGVVSPRGIIIIGLTALVAYLTQWIYPAHYDALIAQETLAVCMLNLRNGALLLLTYLFLTDSRIVLPLATVLPERLFTSSKRTFLIDSLLAALAVVVLLWIRPMLVGTLANSGYVANGQYEALDRLPMSRDTDADTVTIMTDITVPRLAQHRFYRIRPDDCVESLLVNGVPVPPFLVQFCDGAGRGRIFDLGAYLHTGKNTLTVEIRNAGGPIGVDVIPSVTPLLFLALLTVALVMVWYGVQCYLFLCAAHRAEMLYNRCALWITSHLPAPIFSQTSHSGPIQRST